MRLEALKIRNLGPFRDFAVDLAEYDGATLIAVTGPNGAGKSTLLELGIPGALYRSTPTRGSLQDLATARDAMLEARVVNGRAWTLRHLVDPVSGKSEAVVLDAEGRPATDSGKVRDFDRWAATHLPAPEVLFASVFGAQGSAGFLGLKPGERKAVLLRTLGLERLEGLASEARERLRSARSAAEMVQARLDETVSGLDTAAARAAVDEAEREVELADERAAAAARRLESARLEASDYALARQRWEEREQARAGLRRQIAELQQQRDGLALRIANNRAVLAEAEAIRAAVARAAELTTAVDRARAELGEARQARALWEQRQGELDRAAKAAVERLRSVEAQIQGASATLDLAAKLDERRERVADRRGAVAAAELVLRELQESALLGAEGRIGLLRDGLEQIRDGASPNIARATLERDDIAARQAEEHPAKVADAHSELVWARDRLRAAEAELAEAERAAAAVERVRQLEGEQREAIARLAATEAELRAHAESEPGGVEPLSARLRADEEELERARKVAAKADPLGRAEARLAELEPQAERVAADLERATQELAALPEEPAPDAGPSLAALEEDAREAREAASAATARLGAARARLTACEEAITRAEALERDLEVAQAELADWTRLAADLGRDGLQAAEIDAAGPELTELVNDLLHTCVGPRWTVSIETTRLSADGKRQLEGCDVRVIDTERGRDAEASTFSGGERVIIGEAVSLALSMLACRRAGLDGVTLVRDESGAALDPANARAYVAMLRRAAQLVGARNVLFVSHSPEVVELADARIALGGSDS